MGIMLQDEEVPMTSNPTSSKKRLTGFTVYTTIASFASRLFV